MGYALTYANNLEHFLKCTYMSARASYVALPVIINYKNIIIKRNFFNVFLFIGSTNLMIK